MFPTVCRVCLAGDIRMLSMDVQLLDLYEKLINSKVSSGGRGNRLCYICYCQLQKCFRFLNLARRSEKYLRVLESDLEINETTATNMLNLAKLQILSVINLKPISLDGLNKRKNTKNISKAQCDETNIKEEFDKEITNERLLKNETPTLVVTKNVTPTLLVTKNVTRTLLVTKNLTPTILVAKNENMTTEESAKNIITIAGEIKYGATIKKGVNPNETTKVFIQNQLTEDITRKSLTKQELTKNVTLEKFTKNETGEVGMVKCETTENPIENQLVKIETPRKVFKNDTTRLVKKEIIVDGLMKHPETDKELIYFESEDLNEDITDVKDYVVINDTELYYECDTCHDIFKTREELATHQNTHKTDTKTKYKLEDIIERIPNTKEPYCPICKKFFAGYDSQLQEHLRIHTGERPYVCDLCGKTSRTKHHLKEHIRTHTKEKVYCKVCDKGFSQMSSLGKHMLIHTGLSPYFCHICGKSFKQNGQMKAHIRFIHEGVRPHGCDVCGKRFPAKSEWRRHMDAHTGIKAYSCDKCGTKFATNTGMTRHKKRHCKMLGS